MLTLDIQWNSQLWCKETSYSAKSWRIHTNSQSSNDYEYDENEEGNNFINNHVIVYFLINQSSIIPVPFTFGIIRPDIRLIHNMVNCVLFLRKRNSVDIKKIIHSSEIKSNFYSYIKIKNTFHYGCIINCGYMFPKFHMFHYGWTFQPWWNMFL